MCNVNQRKYAHHVKSNSFVRGGRPHLRRDDGTLQRAEKDFAIQWPPPKPAGDKATMDGKKENDLFLHPVSVLLSVVVCVLATHWKGTAQTTSAVKRYESDSSAGNGLRQGQ